MKRCFVYGCKTAVWLLNTGQKVLIVPPFKFSVINATNTALYIDQDFGLT